MTKEETVQEKKSRWSKRIEERKSTRKSDDGEFRLGKADHRLLKLMFEQEAAREAPPKPVTGWMNMAPVDDGKCNRCGCRKPVVRYSRHLLCSSCVDSVRKGAK